jgi:hypothetical protein
MDDPHPILSAMERLMRQVLLAGLIPLIIVGVTAEFSLAQVTPKTADLSANAREIMPDLVFVPYQSLAAQTLVAAQKTTQKKSEKSAKKLDKDKDRDKETKKSPDRVSNYKCIEYCAVVRQSCEELATIQPVSKKAEIGSKENNIWSRECQKIYSNCINRCNFNEEKVNWKRLESKKVKK